MCVDGGWPHLRGQLEYGTLPQEKSVKAFQQTVSSCLRDNLCQRGTIHDIVNVLSEGIR